MFKHSVVALIALASVLIAGLMIGPAAVQADTCLMTYPTAPCEYHYSSTDHYTVGLGHPLYDALYDLGGEVLIKIDPSDGDGIALDVYQAPGLTGLVHDEISQGYFNIGADYDLVVDGYNKSPMTFSNILLVFDSLLPEECVPYITVDGQPAMYDPGLGYYFPVGDLVVSTPTTVGNSHSDTIILSIVLENCIGYRIWAFADDNYSLTHDLPGECFTAFSKDTTIPVSESSWGAIKSLHH
jgi:hypothetical protein